MKDLFIGSNGTLNFEIAEDNKALRSQLGVFLSIRCSNGYDDGELEYDIDQGLDYEFLMDLSISNEKKESYIISKIKKYYKDVKNIKNVIISQDKIERTIYISFEYSTIYNGDYEKMEVSTIV